MAGSQDLGSYLHSTATSTTLEILLDTMPGILILYASVSTLKFDVPDILPPLMAKVIGTNIFLVTL